MLFWAIIGGLALRKIAKPETKHVIGDLSSMVSITVGWVIQLAPFGIMGLVYSAVSENGLGIFTTYGKLLALLVGCMLLVALVVDPLIMFLLLRKNPYPLVFKCLKESGITAFFTRSSAANIPVNMQLAEKLGLEKDFYSVSIPLGATINMDGAAITITVMTLAVAHTRYCSKFPCSTSFKCSCNICCLRFFRCSWRFSTTNTNGLLPIWYT